MNNDYNLIISSGRWHEWKWIWNLCSIRSRMNELSLSKSTNQSTSFLTTDQSQAAKLIILLWRTLGPRESKHLLTPRFGSNLISEPADKDSYNIFIKSVLVPNQIVPRVSPECFRCKILFFNPNSTEWGHSWCCWFGGEVNC